LLIKSEERRKNTSTVHMNFVFLDTQKSTAMQIFIFSSFFVGAGYDGADCQEVVRSQLVGFEVWGS
jgi:hypothetical protein